MSWSWRGERELMPCYGQVLLRDSTLSSCFISSDLAWVSKWSLFPSITYFANNIDRVRESENRFITPKTTSTSWFLTENVSWLNLLWLITPKTTSTSWFLTENVSWLNLLWLITPKTTSTSWFLTENVSWLNLLWLENDKFPCTVGS